MSERIAVAMEPGRYHAGVVAWTCTDGHDTFSWSEADPTAAPSNLLVATQAGTIYHTSYADPWSGAQVLSFSRSLGQVQGFITASDF